MASSRLSRCFTGFLFWPSVSWLFLAHLLPHLSAWFLPGAIPWPKIPWPRECGYLHAAYAQVRKWAAEKRVFEKHKTFPRSFEFFLGYFTIRRVVLFNVTVTWFRIHFFSWTWNEWNRILVGTHILCLSVCGLCLLTCFLSLSNIVFIQICFGVVFLSLNSCFPLSPLKLCKSRRMIKCDIFDRRRGSAHSTLEFRNIMIA